MFEFDLNFENYFCDFKLVIKLVLKIKLKILIFKSFCASIKAKQYKFLQNYQSFTGFNNVFLFKIEQNRRSTILNFKYFLDF